MTLFGTSKNGRLSDVDGTISRIVVTFGVNKIWGPTTDICVHVVSNAFLLQKNMFLDMACQSSFARYLNHAIWLVMDFFYPVFTFDVGHISIGIRRFARRSKFDCSYTDNKRFVDNFTIFLV